MNYIVKLIFFLTGINSLLLASTSLEAQEIMSLELEKAYKANEVEPAYPNGKRTWFLTLIFALFTLAPSSTLVFASIEIYSYLIN